MKDYLRSPIVISLMLVFLALWSGPAVTDAKAASVLLSAAAFVPDGEGSIYSNSGYVLSSWDGGCFVADAQMPPPRPVTVDKIVIYYYDNEPSANIYVTAWRTRPSTEGNRIMEEKGSPSDSPDSPRSLVLKDLQPDTLKSYHGVSLSVCLSMSVKLFGVKVVYH